MGGLLGIAQGQFDHQHAVFVVGDGAVVVDLDLQLDDAAEGAGGDLDLLVDAALGLLQGAAADDRQLAAGDLDPDLGEVDAGEVDFDHGTLRVVDVIDVDVRREAGGPAAHVAGASPGIAHQLVHLQAHPREIGEKVALRHRSKTYPRGGRVTIRRRGRWTRRPSAAPASGAPAGAAGRGPRAGWAGRSRRARRAPARTRGSCGNSSRHSWGLWACAASARA